MRTFRDLYITCSPDEIREIVGQIENNLSNGWYRDKTKEESLLARGSSDMFCFCCGKGPSRQAACLWVASKDETTWYVSNIVPSTVGQLDYDQYNQILEEFTHSFVEPVAQKLGVVVVLTDSIMELSSVLPGEVESALLQFSRAANRSTGSSHPCDQTRWFRFLVLAHQAEVNLDPSTLQRWLVEDEGWPDDVALDLALEYERARALLNYFEDRS